MRKQNSLIFWCLLVILLATLLSKLSLSSSKQPVFQNMPSLVTQPTFSLIPSAKTTTLLAVGDVMLGRYVNVTSQRNQDYRYPFIRTAELLNSADIAFANLETPLIADCPVTATGMIFCAPDKAVEGLVFAGFDVLSLANNHSLNYGKEGQEETMGLLEQSNITPSLQSLMIKTVNGLNFGFLSFDLTVNNRPQPVLDGVIEAVPKVDILIVSLHWGNEYQKEPQTWQTTLARQIIEKGARVIIGHHPHVVQPVEEYDQGLIFYSLGNFVFDQPWSEETKKGQMAKVVFTKNGIESYRLFPVYIENSQPKLTQKSFQN